MAYLQRTDIHQLENHISDLCPKLIRQLTFMRLLSGLEILLKTSESRLNQDCARLLPWAVVLLESLGHRCIFEIHLLLLLCFVRGCVDGWPKECWSGYRCAYSLILSLALDCPLVLGRNRLAVLFDSCFQHGEHSVVENLWPGLACLKTAPVRHDNILERYNCCLSYLGSLVWPKTLDPLKKNLPNLLVIDCIYV